MLEKQIENFLDAIGKGITTMSTKIKLEKLEQELADISAKITAEECKQQIGLSRAEIIAHIRSALQKEPQQMINALVNKVILYNDKIEIYYNYTLRKDPDDRCQGLLFYSGESSISVCVSYTKVIQQPILTQSLVNFCSIQLLHNPTSFLYVIVLQQEQWIKSSPSKSLKQ